MMECMIKQNRCESPCDRSISPAYSSDDVSETKQLYNKSLKPLMEKRRRARINTCLEELKSLLQNLLSEETLLSSKMEKADILDLAVRYLRSVRRRQLQAACVVDPRALDNYRAGYSECMGEISRYISAAGSLPVDTKIRMMTHLARSLTPLQNAPATGTPAASAPLTDPRRALPYASPTSAANNGPRGTKPLSPMAGSTVPTLFAEHPYFQGQTKLSPTISSARGLFAHRHHPYQHQTKLEPLSPASSPTFVSPGSSTDSKLSPPALSPISLSPISQTRVPVRNLADIMASAPVTRVENSLPHTSASPAKPWRPW